MVWKSSRHHHLTLFIRHHKGDSWRKFYVLADARVGCESNDLISSFRWKFTTSRLVRQLSEWRLMIIIRATDSWDEQQQVTNHDYWESKEGFERPLRRIVSQCVIQHVVCAIVPRLITGEGVNWSVDGEDILGRREPCYTHAQCVAKTCN